MYVCCFFVNILVWYCYVYREKIGLDLCFCVSFLIKFLINKVDLMRCVVFEVIWFFKYVILSIYVMLISIYLL